MQALFRLPVIVLLILTLAALMAGTALVAVAMGDREGAVGFGVHAALTGSLGVMAALAVWGRGQRRTAARDISTLLAAYILVPLLAALPFSAVVAQATLSQSYFEMMSSFTTTGATLFREPGSVAPVGHFWRATIGWFGGLVILVAAFTLLRPLRIGGFELDAPNRSMRARDDPAGDMVHPADRLHRTVRLVVPIYSVLTLALALALVAAGEPALVAVCHAMSVLSTSGISPVGGLENAEAGWLGEVAVLLFLLVALTHRTYGGVAVFGRGGPLRDPEVRTGAILVLGASLVLFLRHFTMQDPADGGEGLLAGLRAAWGILFTATSFLTTTGFLSDQWELARVWSDMPAIGLVPIVLALAGGGIATTAGGIKLLRIFALYKHGVREIERLVHPSSVGRYGATARRIRREGAFVAWIFVMLFLLTLAMVMLLLAATGAEFETALVLSLAALANSGPLAGVFGGEVSGFGQLAPEARAILCAAMLIGRVEVLAVVAVLNPEYWRN